jgi:uncharacterized protein (DUF1778 family)
VIVSFSRFDSRTLCTQVGTKKLTVAVSDPAVSLSIVNCVLDFVMTMSGNSTIYGVRRMTMPLPTTRSEKLDLRLTRQAKQKLASAARIARRSVGDFVLQSALERADETLADRRVFLLDAKAWNAFQAALDAPPSSNPALRTLLSRKSVFDRY